MRRRAVLGGVSAAALTTACKPGTPILPIAPAFQWNMVTSWSADFPGLNTGAIALAERITQMSGGRLKIKVHAADELVPAFEVFDAVAAGTAEMAHSCSYYWSGKSPAAAFFASVPFGMNAQESNAWLYRGGGLELWRELYALFGLRPFPAGNTGAQMAGWFKQPIRSLRSLRGLKMRIPGLGAVVFEKLGGIAQSVPGKDLIAALASGALDAAEWLGPHHDLEFGLHQVAGYYYYPSWQEPACTLECVINQKAFEGLPADLQATIETACSAVNNEILAEYTALNHQALGVLINEHKIEVRRLPEDVLTGLRHAAETTIAELARKDAFTKRVVDSYTDFREQTKQWHRISEQAFYAARG